MFCFRNKLTEVNKSAKAVKDSTSEARLALDQNFEKLKTTLLKSLEDRRQELVSIIDDAQQKDLESLGDLQERLQNDINKVNSLVERGMFDN